MNSNAMEMETDKHVMIIKAIKICALYCDFVPVKYIMRYQKLNVTSILAVRENKVGETVKIY